MFWIACWDLYLTRYRCTIGTGNGDYCAHAWDVMCVWWLERKSKCVHCTARFLEFWLIPSVSQSGCSFQTAVVLKPLHFIREDQRSPLLSDREIGHWFAFPFKSVPEGLRGFFVSLSLTVSRPDCYLCSVVFCFERVSVVSLFTLFSFMSCDQNTLFAWLDERMIVVLSKYLRNLC